jgi:hypothetical protein
LASIRIKDADYMNGTLIRAMTGNLKPREYCKLVTLGDFLYFIDRGNDVMVRHGNANKARLFGALYNLLQQQALVLKVVRRGRVHVEVQFSKTEPLTLLTLLFLTAHLN